MTQYLYHINYQDYEDSLCALEMRALFVEPVIGKVFESEQRVDASISPYIKSRIEILFRGESVEDIVEWIKTTHFSAQAFNVEYVPVIKRDPQIKKRKEICKSVGYVIQGFPSFTNPDIRFGVTCYDDVWYFGIVEHNSMKWKEHNNKPHAYSSSLGINLAKALVNIATKGDRSKTIIDPCCGVGTVILEACFSGYKIHGCEIKRKVAVKARDNISHYLYNALITRGDIKDIDEEYDVAIVDLPYGNFSHTDEENMLIILRHSKRIARRQVIISSEDISEQLLVEGFNVTENCITYKNKSRKFARYIWICES